MYNEFNGSISSANLASNAVTTAKITDANVTTAKIADSNITTAKIADDSVTDAKLTYGKVYRRLGGSATDWSSPGSTTQTISGEVIIQVGTITSSTTADVAVTFPVAFSQPPIVIGSQAKTTSSSTFFRVNASATSTTGFSFSMITTSNTRAAEVANWIAIGPA